MPAESYARVRWPVAIGRTLRTWLAQDGEAQCVAASADLDVPAADRARIANAVPRRQAEFVAGRWCAYASLARLGVVAPGLPSDALGGPMWPGGVTGSITHESGICAAAVARSAFARGIGIDLFDRRHTADMQQIAGLVLAEDEMPLLDGCADATGFIQLAFSIKEAVVKAVSSTVGRYLDMHEISLSIGPDAFAARIACLPGRVAGKWGRIGPYFLTFAVFGPPHAAAAPDVLGLPHPMTMRQG